VRKSLKTWLQYETHIAFNFPHVKETALRASDEHKSQTISST